MHKLRNALMPVIVAALLLALFVAGCGDQFQIQRTSHMSGPLDITGGGSASAPALYFAGDSDTGIYRSAANNWDVTTGGTRRLNVSSSGLDLQNLPALNVGAAGTDFGTDGSLTTAKAVTVTSGGLNVVAGGLTVTAGGATITEGGLDMTNDPITNIGAAGTDFGSDGSLTTAQTITVTAGGLNVVAGGATITAGGLTVTAGGATITAGGLDMTDDAITNIGAAGTDFSGTGGLTLADALVVSSGGADITGGLTIGEGDLADSTILSADIKDGEIVNGDLSASAAVDYSKLAALTAANILVGSAGNVATVVNPAGDVEISNDGTTSIESGVIVNDDISASADIAYSKMANTNVVLSDGTNTLTLDEDATLSADATGGNALAKNEFIGLPRITMVALSTMANGTTNTVLTDIGDSETPATDWTAITGNTVMSNDGTYYRQGTASLKMAISSSAAVGDGCVNTLASGDQDWTADEGFGFWFYTTKALDAGDLMLEVYDATAGGGKTAVAVPAATVDSWQWLEVDVTLGADADKDVVTDLKFVLSAAGAAKAGAGAFDAYFDFIVKWDVDEEEALGQQIPYDGVLAVIMTDVTSAAASNSNLVEYTDYFAHYQTGNDAIVIITDQSDADKLGMALIAY